jgi:hypothetical protein
MHKPNPNPTDQEINDFILNTDIAEGNIGSWYGYALVKSGVTVEASLDLLKSREETERKLIDEVAKELNKEW